MVVIAGLCILPALYAWFNIGANMDPYGNTSEVKVAVACEDEGVTIDELGTLNVGDEIEKKLKKNDQLGWTFMSEKEAVDGVYAGDYYAAIVVPENFSENLTSFLKGEVEQPQIDYYVNEKKNAIAPKVTDSGATTIQLLIDENFTEIVSVTIADFVDEIAGTVIGQLDSNQGKLTSSIEKTRKSLKQYQKVINSFNKTHKTNKNLSTSADNLISSMENNLDALQTVLATNLEIINKTDTDVEKLRNDVQTYSDLLGTVGKTVLDSLNETDQTIHNVQQTIILSQGLATSIAPAGNQARSILSSLDSGLDHANSAMNDLSDALESTDSTLLDAELAIASLESTNTYQNLTKLTQLDSDKIGEFMASPIKLKSKELYPVENYGSGMAPFYTMLAIWVSGLILISIISLEVDTDEEERTFTMTETYLARGLFFTILGLIQAIIICLGDLYLIGIQCIHPVAFIGACLLASVVFVNLIYGFAVAFRHIGKAVAVILVILQIPGSSGTYPIELTGSFFRAIHPFLPFTYGINALRETIAGFYGHTYLESMAMLGLFMLVALFIGLVLRPLMKNLNHTFDTRLHDAEIFATEEGIGTHENKRLKQAIGLIYSDAKARKVAESRTAKFKRRYDKVVEGGIKYIFIPPAVLLILMCVTPYKMVMLCLWIVSIIGIAISLVAFEHMHITIEEERYLEEDAEYEKHTSDI